MDERDDIPPEVREKLQRAVDSGGIRWSGRRLTPRPAQTFIVRGSNTAAEMLLEDGEPKLEAEFVGTQRITVG